ncbi:hypothetical protein EDF56_106349 [Novosphingobium sp. PhB165]|uniref:hypothetical protein n=1 Tax=Novosphingobium sp. PhB165 TaxID=2485105 RepID=UPI00104C65E8|nr:hypothetical protein [Novosphingobium sp. PhB165]TCM17233.1 hypothetical protein EDF56_106349 [Novosphingobium sp. PhB165]
MDDGNARDVGALQGYRIASQTLLAMVIADLYSRLPDGAEAFDRLSQELITALYSIQPGPFGGASGDLIREQAIFAAEALCKGIVPDLKSRAA